MARLKKTTIGFAFCLLLSQSAVNKAYAQTSATMKFKEKPSSCEFVRGILDSAIAETINLADMSYAIFVFRLGKNETSKKIIEKRKEVVRKHFKYRAPNFKNYLLKEEEPNSEIGKIEIYIKGRMRSVIFIEKDKNLGDNCKEESY